MSATVRESVTLAAAPEQVWEVLMDPLRLDEWVVIAHAEVPDPPSEPLEAGDSFEQTLSLAGRSIKVRWTLLDADSPRWARWRAEGPMGTAAEVVYELKSVDGGTRFDYCNEFELPSGPFRRFADRVAGAPAARVARRSLQRLKRLIESG